MKLWYIIPVLLFAMGASCERKPTIEMPKYPANLLVECPELKPLVLDEAINGIALGEYYKNNIADNKQYADCATIHNELVRFIKQQQKEK